jgi:hypothetical protein
VEYYLYRAWTREEGSRFLLHRIDDDFRVFLGVEISMLRLMIKESLLAREKPSEALV